MTASRPYDFAHVYAALKDFQRATVDHVTQRLFGPDHSERFLVADEVGLGKTLVATGVVARTIEHHVELGTPRIDILYICSNGDIARQNTNRIITRLGIPEVQHVRPIDRLTLLPRAVHDLKRRHINFLSLTPGTSFSLRSSEGIVEERMLLHTLLRDAWGPGALRGNPALRVFAGGAGFERFKQRVGHYRRSQRLDEGLSSDFADAVEREAQQARARGGPDLRARLENLRGRFRRERRHRPTEDVSLRRRFIGDLRELLARTCIGALEPDLVILDEFQRFKSLLDGTAPASDLARVLFTYEGVRLLLLSATPYKMYTLADETDDDHHADLVRTLSFLAGEHDAAGFADDLRDFRGALLTLDGAGLDAARQAKTRVEQRLRQVMVRTERLSATADRSGMLTERPTPGLHVTAEELHQYVQLERVAELINGGPVLDFWKSTPYPLNFMEHYRLDRALEAAVDDGRQGPELAGRLADGDLLLPWDDVARYRQVDPGNARLRGLFADVIDRGAWQLPWLPPALTYYELGPPWNQPGLESFTKRLVFSAWRVVPKVIATLASYEAERRLMNPDGRPDLENTPEARSRFRPLLQFTRSRERLTGMPVFALLYPSPSLARLGDPREVSAMRGGAEQPVPREVVVAEVRGRIERALRPRLDDAPSVGPVDEAWYWAAPLLLDHDAGAWNRGWWEAKDLASHWLQAREEEEAEEHTAGWQSHVEEARLAVMGRRDPLGRPPDDLLAVLAELAVGGPAVCTLRALARGARVQGALLAADTRRWAAYASWGFRSLFNLPEMTTYLRRAASGERRRDEAYWRLVLRACVDGGLQCVLDEYVHVLGEALGVAEGDEGRRLEEVAEEIRDALSVRAATYTVHEVTVEGGQVELRRQPMRGRFALRFGDDRAEEERTIGRQAQVRTAFNSPFWPFVLATTSIGQEGLDFHQYCHAVVHWNLPPNPVDLEQREGRVHRYKGHAIRKNVATAHRAVAFGTEPDPWQAMFEAADATREAHHNEVV
ncbi:MAG: helicase, partial [Actinomycetota bacterium]|nr:helicase [Actinomycetota bacterium]